MENQEMKRLSRAAIEEYRAKLDQLKNVTRLEVAQQIKEARAFGDISENAEYDAAMDNQARIEYEIVQLEELLANVEEIDSESLDLSTVNVGGRVRVVCVDTGHEEEFDIVSTSEINPFGHKVIIECAPSDYNTSLGYAAKEHVEIIQPPKLSNESPLGRALLGHKSGDRVDVVTPRGSMQYKITDIVKVPEAPQGKIVSEMVIG